MVTKVCEGGNMSENFLRFFLNKYIKILYFIIMKRRLNALSVFGVVFIAIVLSGIAYSTIYIDGTTDTINATYYYQNGNLVLDRSSLRLTGQNLIGYWGFDENVGNVSYDYSGHNIKGNITNGNWVEGVYGTAIDFNGSQATAYYGDNSYLDITDEITLMAWVKIHSLLNAGLISKHADSSYGLYYWGEFGNFFNFYITAPNGTVYEFPFPSNNDLDWQLEEWHHIAVTYNGSKVREYVDGSLCKEYSYSGGIKESDKPFEIGRAYGWDHGINATIDEVKVYNVSLSTTEVYTDYAIGNNYRKPTGFFSDNIIIPAGKKICLDGNTCSHYIWFNGTSVVIE